MAQAVQLPRGDQDPVTGAQETPASLPIPLPEVYLGQDNRLPQRREFVVVPINPLDRHECRIETMVSSSVSSFSFSRVFLRR